MPGLTEGAPLADDSGECPRPLERAQEEHPLQQAQGGGAARDEKQGQRHSGKREQELAATQKVRAERQRGEDDGNEQEVPHERNWIRSRWRFV